MSPVCSFVCYSFPETHLLFPSICQLNTCSHFKTIQLFLSISHIFYAVKIEHSSFAILNPWRDRLVILGTCHNILVHQHMFLNKFFSFIVTLFCVWQIGIQLNLTILLCKDTCTHARTHSYMHTGSK